MAFVKGYRCDISHKNDLFLDPLVTCKPGIGWYTLYVMENTTLQTLLASLTSTASALKGAKAGLHHAISTQVATERVLNMARNSAIAEGKAIGKNEAERNASLAMMLVEETKAFEIASDEVSSARLAHELAYVDHQVNRYAFRAMFGSENDTI